MKTLVLSLQWVLTKWKPWDLPKFGNGRPLSWTGESYCWKECSILCNYFGHNRYFWWWSSNWLYKRLSFNVLVYLKFGTGDPWAGQVKLNGMASFASNPEIFELIASLGAAPPIGSTIGKVRLLIYLNPGTGNPWAGQERLRSNDFFTSLPSTLAATDILGEDPPIGSDKIKSTN